VVQPPLVPVEAHPVGLHHFGYLAGEVGFARGRIFELESSCGKP